MPSYPFICVACLTRTDMILSSDQYIELTKTSQPPCTSCKNGKIRRIYTPISMSQPFREHKSAATGTRVSNKHQFRDDLKKKSEKASERLGFDHNFVPVDLADMKPKGYDEWLEKKKEPSGN